jgi:hypothetical protein
VKIRAADRRYGLVLDGSVLTSATTERGKVVSVGTMAADSAHDALHRWWERVRPRGRVTVAVITETAQVASVEVAPDVPPALVRRHVESRLQSTSSGLPASFAVAARIPDGEGPSSACVAAVPVEVMEDLWRAERGSVRYTVPAMAYTIGGIHLVVAHSASELVLVDGTRREPVDSVLLASGGIVADADPDERRVHAELVAEEVDRAVESWRRRGHPIDSDVVHVTGAGVVGDDMFGALALRGYRPRLDLVSHRLDHDALQVLRNDPATLLRCALAAAVAVCDPGPLGFLVPPGPRGTPQVAERIGRWVAGLAKGPTRSGTASTRIRVAAVAAVAAVVIGLAGAAWTVPASIGSRTAAAALARHQQAVDVEARLAPDITLARYNRWSVAQRSRLAGPAWSRVVPAILGTVPPGVAVQSMTVTDSGDHLAVTVTANALDAGLAPVWLARLRVAHVEASTPGVTVDRTGVATFTTTFAVSRAF